MSEEMKLPKHWEFVKLRDVCNKIIGGGTPSTAIKEYWEGDIPWISSADIYGLKEINPRRKISKTAIDNSTTNLLKKGGIIVVTRVGLGKIAIAPYDICFSQDCQGLVLNEKLISQTYALLILSKAVNKFKTQSRGTTISGVTKKQLEELEIPLPPLPEQQAIVSRIEELLSDLENGKQQLQTAQQQLKIYRQSLLKWAFEGKLTNKKVKVGELPKGWKIAVLNDVAEMCLGKMLDKNKNKGNYQYYLRNISVRWGSFDLDNLEQMKFEESEEERYSLKKNDLVICEGGEPGRCAIWKGTVPKMKIQKALHRVRVKNMLSAEFLFHFMYYSGICGLLEKYFTGTTIKHLTGGGLKKIELPLPPLTEQQLIVSELESKLTICDKIAETIAQSLQQTETLRQSILKKAFEGKLVTVQTEKRKKLVPA